MKKLEVKHPLAIRWNHWVNFPVLTIMIWSGLLIYWATPAYFIPRQWLQALDMNQRLAEGMSWHFVFAIIFAVNGFLYAGFLILSGQYKYLLPDRKSLRQAILIFLHDFKIYKKALPPPVKYNAAQRIAYTSVFIFGVAALITGLAIYKPTQLNWLVALLGGYTTARLEHFSITLLFLAFFVVHIIQVLRSGWNNFRAMITGTEQKHVE